MYRLLLPLVAMACVLASCSDTPADPNDPSGSGASPKTGSVFTYDMVQTDTSTGAPIEATRRTSVITIGATGVSYMGRNNCTEFTTVDQGTSNKQYFNYLANGDFEIYQPASYAGQLRYSWSTVPVKSGGKTTTVLFDTTMSVGSFSIQNRMSMIYDHVGTETITVAGNALETVRIKQTTEIYMNANGTETKQELVGYINYALSLGMPVKWDYSLMRISSSGAATTGMVMTLKEYDLK